jgi:RimJ/RimL family protein N-acetyltransferase
MLKAAIDASLEHLIPWMPWARDEPQSVDTKVELLRQFRGRFDLGRDLVYGLFTPDERAVVGGAGLHPCGGSTASRRQERDAREIGYWVASEHAGRGLATEAAGALVRTAFELERLERVEIHCEVENVRSAAVARTLGFKEDGVLRQRLRKGDGQLASKLVFSMLAHEYDETPASRIACEAFDALGRKTLELPLPRGERRKSAFR